MSKSNSKKTTRNYLNSLTKKELIDLIFKLAPQSFLDQINSQFTSQEDAGTIFAQASKAIVLILSDEIFLFSPSKFERELLKQLGKIGGLWDKLPLKIGDLLITIIEEIDQAFEDGYLYIEKYEEDDDYFESEEVNDYIFRFVSNLPQDMKNDYLKNRKKALDNCGHSTFSSVERRLN